LRAALVDLGWHVSESCANCLFADLGEPAAPTIARLLGAGIVVRTFDAMPTCLRITIGSRADNDRVLEALGCSAARPGAPAPGRGERVGGLPTSLLPHLFDSLSREGRLAIHLDGHGGDDHHVIEAAFKALALALREAVSRDQRRAGALPSTKGAM